jgi:hypothetical protein
MMDASTKMSIYVQLMIPNDKKNKIIEMNYDSQN